MSSSTTMRAAVVNDSQKIDISNKPVPRDLKPNEVLFKVVALGQSELIRSSTDRVCLVSRRPKMLDSPGADKTPYNAFPSPPPPACRPYVGVADDGDGELFPTLIN